MRGLFQCFLVALCSSTFALTIHGDDSDFIDEKGKALRHLKVVPGTKRNNVDFHTVEQEAGRAVLKLLDAKIGKKVNDAAKEVTDFLNDAVGHHADQRAANIQSDKQKEMSLLHLGAKKVLTNQDEENKPKKNKDGSFLVNFKIPYIVTPVDAKKKPKAKKFHHKHAKKPHWKKYHHRVLHHKHHHHHHHHHPHVSDASKHPASSPPAPYNTQAQAPQAQSPPPSYNAIDLSFNGYNWTYNYSNDTSQDMTPCQGNCMDPCTQQCSMSQDCCCCDPNLMAQTQMAAAPAAPAAPVAPAAPAYQQVVPMAQPEYQPPPMPAVQPEQCPMGCKRNCFTYCPRDCCGVAGKRDKVLGSGSKEDTADQMENEHEGSGNESVAEETKQSQVEDSDEQQSTKSSEKEDDSPKSEEETTDADQEGSTENQNDEAELDD